MNLYKIIKTLTKVVYKKAPLLISFTRRTLTEDKKKAAILGVFVLGLLTERPWLICLLLVAATAYGVFLFKKQAIKKRAYHEFSQFVPIVIPTSPGQILA